MMIIIIILLIGCFALVGVIFWGLMYVWRSHIEFMQIENEYNNKTSTNIIGLTTDIMNTLVLLDERLKVLEKEKTVEVE